MMRWTTTPLVFVMLFVSTVPVMSNTHDSAPYPGIIVMKTAHSYEALADRLIAAVRANKMGVVARASATIGAKSLGITIAGNQVVMVFNPKFAVRMLNASVPAGIEAPMVRAAGGGEADRWRRRVPLARARSPSCRRPSAEHQGAASAVQISPSRDVPGQHDDERNP